MPASSANYFYNFRTLVLPDKFRSWIQHFSGWHQMSIALLLNLLSLALPVMMLQVYDRIIPHQSYSTLAVLTIGVVIALLMDACLRLTRAWLVSRSAASHEHAAACAAMERFSLADIVAFEKTDTGEHLQNLSAFGRLREFYSGQALTSLIDLPFVVLFLGMIWYLGGTLVFVPMVILAAFVISAHYAGKLLHIELERRNQTDDEKSGFVVTVLTGIHSVKAISLESMIMRKFEAVQNRVTNQSYRVAVASGQATTLSAVFGQLSLILTATFGCLLVVNGHLSVGGLSACTLLAGRTIQPIQRVLGTWLRLQDLSIAREQAEKVLSLPVMARPSEMIAPERRGYVLLEDVSFSYAQDPTPLLKDISFEVKPGDTIAISGSKSSGKSTLLQLVSGLLVPTSGTLRINDLNPGEFGLSALRHQVGYMPQHGVIFRGTILENIAGFRQDNESLNQARIAGQELGLDAVVDLMPRGYQTLLTDTVADPVPPGIKQRIALARVLAQRPSIILFDDADRALDKDGYNLLFRLMGRLKGTCTLIMVTEDNNLMSFADRFYELNEGKLYPTANTSAQNLSLLVPSHKEKP